jgi:hypothetical protein
MVSEEKEEIRADFGYSCELGFGLRFNSPLEIIICFEIKILSDSQHFVWRAVCHVIKNICVWGLDKQTLLVFC